MGLYQKAVKGLNQVYVWHQIISLTLTTTRIRYIPIEVERDCSDVARALVLLTCYAGTVQVLVIDCFWVSTGLWSFRYLDAALLARYKLCSAVMEGNTWTIHSW